MKYLFDILAVAGIGLIAGGLSLYNIPLALVITGILFLGISYFGAKNNGAED